MAPIIKFADVTYQYPDGTNALDNISLEVEPGEKVALIGANGAGKSTLLLHLNGILRGSGQVIIKGLEMNKETLGQIRALVGLVFQNPDDQLFSLSVFDDVAYGLHYQGYDKRTVEERVERALADVRLQGFGERNPYHLSGGEKKRAAIATVLAMQSEILAIDEPTSGIDPRARRELITLLSALPQTMLIATHDLNLAHTLTSRTVILNQGRIIADGKTRTILNDLPLLVANGLL